MSVRATFRRDARLVEVPGGGLRLQRRLGPRLVSIALVVAAAAIGVVDLYLNRPILAAIHAVLALAFAALLVRAELDSFRFEGRTVLRRAVSLTGMTETRLDAKAVSRIGVERAGERARVWIETKDGEQVALVDGEAAVVEPMAEKLARAIRFAAAGPGTDVLH